VYPGFPPQAGIIMLFVDIILYYLLALYLENVVPSSSGVKLPPWFFLVPSYWFPEKYGQNASKMVFSFSFEVEHEFRKQPK